MYRGWVGGREGGGVGGWVGGEGGGVGGREGGGVGGWAVGGAGGWGAEGGLYHPQGDRQQQCVPSRAQKQPQSTW